ncbi:TetR family transcriptional regulator [Bacillus sp. MUM 116]|uniref:TetR/AcrR family transcriptional regulator n=1 Tax=Bacillus sp. MUM 116 TaxID=1678002 RepID=UPI0008F590DF|nr:TetR/AcrR family transcriptional regulator [Bacillus sp. MUM 116]OIK12657.1 TetR family transcriptional regulator [Bacillus sp. MUM 116]
MKKREVLASVKDEKLIEMRRDQIIKGAVNLFKDKGFHRTTTREIAKSAGIGFGTLYHYIRQKEDVLYLVCDKLYDQVHSLLEQGIDTKQGTIESLKQAMKIYFKVIDEMQDEVLILYQETKSLSKDALPYVLDKEIAMTNMFKSIIDSCVKNGELNLSEKESELIAHNITVSGEMWSFRRWGLQKRFAIDEFVALQLNIFIKAVTNPNDF